MDYGDRSFLYIAPTLWNKLLEEWRLAKTTDFFKSRLKQHTRRVQIGYN